MPPVARRWLRFEENDPRSFVLQAIDERFPESLELFFDQVGHDLGIRPDSASSSFYGFMRGSRPLPKSHKRAYERFAGISPALIEQIEATRARPLAPPLDLMADLQAQVNEMARRLRKVDELEHEVRRVDHRVSRLEDRLT
jgi:hypothetical protein